MGLFFSNIQIRRTENEPDFAQIAAVLTEGRDTSAVDSEEEADIMLSVFTMSDSPWITVCSDLIDGDFEELGAKARRLSETLQTQTLALACLDSDYFCMNLIDAANGADLWAANGRMTGGKAPRRSSLAPWKRYVSDIEAFKRTMRGKYVFAEECLDGLEQLLSLPVLQGEAGGDELPEDAEIHRFYYVLNRQENKKVPPRFNYNLPSCHYVYFEGNKENVIGFLNQGGKSKGVGVWLSGPCIWKHEFRATKTMLQMRGAHDEWQFVPIEMKEATTADGVSGLYGECADLRIPPAVPEGLPWKRKMDMEARRAIRIRFSLEKDQAKKDAEEYGDLQVTMIPLQNVSGQSSWVMTCYPKKTWKEWLWTTPNIEREGQTQYAPFMKDSEMEKNRCSS